MSKSQPQAIKDVVSAVLEKLKSKIPEREVRLLQEWKRVVKGNIAKHSKPVIWKGSSVIVNVDSSSYLYELNLQKEKILNKLKKHLGKEKVDEIRFRIGSI